MKRAWPASSARETPTRSAVEFHPMLPMGRAKPQRLRPRPSRPRPSRPRPSRPRLSRPRLSRPRRRRPGRRRPGSHRTGHHRSRIRRSRHRRSRHPRAGWCRHPMATQRRGELHLPRRRRPGRHRGAGPHPTTTSFGCRHRRGFRRSRPANRTAEPDRRDRDGSGRRGGSCARRRPADSPPRNWRALGRWWPPRSPCKAIPSVASPGIAPRVGRGGGGGRGSWSA